MLDLLIFALVAAATPPDVPAPFIGKWSLQGTSLRSETSLTFSDKGFTGRAGCTVFGAYVAWRPRSTRVLITPTIELDGACYPDERSIESNRKFWREFKGDVLDAARIAVDGDVLTVVSKDGRRLRFRRALP